MPFHWSFHVKTFHESFHVNDVLIGQGFEGVIFLVGIGISKMMPLNDLEGLAVTGREQAMERPATSVSLRSFYCCSWEEGKAGIGIMPHREHPSPPCITSESRTSPIRSLRAR
jgi:hypothetical protein